MSAFLEVLAFSSVLAAGVAGALTLAAGFALVGHSLPLAAALAFAGTLVVYNVDRLRDLDRDMLASPRRSAFVRARRGPIVGLVAVATGCAGLLAWRVGPPSVALCAALLLPSLFHRRIKRHPAVKVGYVTAAWVAATVGLAALGALERGFGQGPEATGFWSVAGWVAAIYGASIGANLVASNAQGFGNLAGSRVSTWGARGLAAAGVLIALAGPEATQPLFWIPLAQLAGVFQTADGERARLLRVDGLLLIGALVPLSLELAT